MIEGYRDSTLGIIPKGWKAEVLRNVAKCTVGIATSTTHAYCEKGVLLLRNQNIKEGKIALNDVLYIKPEFDIQNKSKRLRKDDIITVRTGYPGISAVVPEELEGSQSFTTLITRLCNSNVLSHFLCYYINSEKGKTFFKNNQAGGGQQNVGSKTLENMLFPLPPLPEQQKIAEILTTVDDKIEVINQQITETQELKKGLMQRLLTKGIGHSEFKDSPLGKIPESWEVVRLGKIADINKNSLSNATSDDYEFKYIDLSAVKTGKIEFPHERIEFSNSPSRARRIIKMDDIIMATVRPNLLGFGHVNFDTENIICSTGFAIISPKENISGQFIYQNLYSKNIESQINKLIVGSNYPAINSSDVQNIKIPLPTLEEQQKIAAILSSADEKLEVLAEKKVNYQELKQGLMQQLLTGKIRVKV